MTIRNAVSLIIAGVLTLSRLGTATAKGKGMPVEFLVRQRRWTEQGELASLDDGGFDSDR